MSRVLLSLAEYEALKKENENLIKTVKLLEETGKKQRDEAKEDTEKWKSKFVERQQKVEKLEKDIQDLVAFNESQTNGVDSGNGNAATSNTVSDEGVITISDDEDGEGNEGESNGGYARPQFSFII